MGLGLFVVEHAHTDQTCPGNSIEGVRMMGDLVLGKEHAEQTGTKLLNDYHVKGQHRLLLVVEADSRVNVEDYAKPFQQVGNTQVLELDHCATLMQRVIAKLQAQRTSGENEACATSASAAGCGCRSA